MIDHNYEHDAHPVMHWCHRARLWHKPCDVILPVSIESDISTRKNHGTNEDSLGLIH
ncbi:hypothetical protein XF_0571 [Xylella fastidiosa 9a5c]|uniref:Uncharacterized protein n=1 Tax=Xylella fastidiosa (strain 9a5c) TaxID=160492 RepID=Q9PFT6_XYLFA|nr:hypothetical protein XF_0571 [Xylella fastidiosa 9a5c]